MDRAHAGRSIDPEHAKRTESSPRAGDARWRIGPSNAAVANWCGVRLRGGTWRRSASFTYAGVGSRHRASTSHSNWWRGAPHISSVFK